MSSLNKYIGNNKLVLLICAPDLTASGSAWKLAKSRFGKMFGVVAVIMLATVAKETEAYWTHNTGRGMVYGLGVTQDTTLEGSTQHNRLQYLMVSKHPQFPNKRSLVQFENLPNACGPSQIVSAKMYLFYVYAHKASWHTIQRNPFIPRFMQVHLVKKSWNAAQATSTKRDRTHWWSRSYLGLDNTDAEAQPQAQTVTIFPYRPRGYVEFDITRAMRRWRSGVPNYGLLIRATNELENGRGIRFASSDMSDTSWRPYALVLCA